MNPPVLSPFNPENETVLETDASRLKGLGYALRQLHNGKWHLIQCGSRYLSDTETRYPTTELEMLAIVWATKKCKNFLLGLPHFSIKTDHRPLIPILDSKGLGEVENQRLQRLKEKLMPFSFTTHWVKGKENIIPDVLSRSPVGKPTPEDIVLCNNIEMDKENITKIQVATAGVTEGDTANGDVLLQEIIEAAKSDDTYQDLMKKIISGFPRNVKDVESPNNLFWNVREELSTDGEIAYLGSRIIIPAGLRKEMLRRLHLSHQGIEKTKQRARQTVYWPSINNDIVTTVTACRKCQERQPSQCKEPMTLGDSPERVFQEVSLDFFNHAGKDFLVYVDRLSGWPVLFNFNRGDTKTKSLIQACRKCFADLGVPEKMRTDGGPQFKSREFGDFLRRFGVMHETSSPYYPKSNGHAEAAVKSMKSLIAKTTENGKLNCDEFYAGLLEYRNTPKNGTLSPAQILFGHQLRSLVPAQRRSLDRKWTTAMEEYNDRRFKEKMRNAENYNRSAKNLPPLTIGTE